jgi:hypothetical protein
VRDFIKKGVFELDLKTLAKTDGGTKNQAKEII